MRVGRDPQVLERRHDLRRREQRATQRGADELGQHAAGAALPPPPVRAPAGAEVRQAGEHLRLSAVGRRGAEQRDRREPQRAGPPDERQDRRQQPRRQHLDRQRHLRRPAREHRREAVQQRGARGGGRCRAEHQQQEQAPERRRPAAGTGSRRSTPSGPAAPAPAASAGCRRRSGRWRSSGMPRPAYGFQSGTVPSASARWAVSVIGSKNHANAPASTVVGVCAPAPGRPAPSAGSSGRRRRRSGRMSAASPPPWGRPRRSRARTAPRSSASRSRHGFRAASSWIGSARRARRAS